MLILLAGCACGSTASDAPQSSSPRTCTSTPNTYVAVHARERELVLCDDGKAVRRFGVRLARHGVGKQHERDGKLPLGRYSLGDAVASAHFGLFLPISYPTAEQRARGMTGSAVGVHGPVREARWLGALVNTFDTTEGCIGLATDEDVREIAVRGRTDVLDPPETVSLSERPAFALAGRTRIPTRVELVPVDKRGRATRHRIAAMTRSSKKSSYPHHRARPQRAGATESVSTVWTVARLPCLV